MGQEEQRIREISLILRATERVVGAVGVACANQLQFVYVDMLRVYKLYSDFIASAAANQMRGVRRDSVRLMRNVKRDTLQLVRTFVEKAATEPTQTQPGEPSTGSTGSQQQLQFLAQRFIPPLLEPVLADYKNQLPMVREAEVLDLLTTLATRLSDAISSEVPRIFEMVFECTLDMIKG